MANALNTALLGLRKDLQRALKNELGAPIEEARKLPNHNNQNILHKIYARYCHSLTLNMQHMADMVTQLACQNMSRSERIKLRKKWRSYCVEHRRINKYIQARA